MALRPPAAPDPGERRSTGYAYQLLREQIISGEIAAGSAVSQAALAEQLGMSRTPLREATRLLQNEGLLVGEPNRRLRVATISLPDLDQLYAIRIVTEAMATRLAVARMDDDHRSLIAAELIAMEESAAGRRHENFDDHHRAFHRLLVAPAGERFESISSTLWDHTTRYRSAYLSAAGNIREAVEAAGAEHHQIATAVLAGDANAAAAALAAHYARTAGTIFAAADPEFEAMAVEAALAASAAGTKAR